MIEGIFTGIGICVVAAVALTLLFALIDWLYKRYIGDPINKRKERAEAIEKLAKEQALMLAMIEPSDFDQKDWGRFGICKASFTHIRFDALRLSNDESFKGKIERIRGDVNENGKVTERSKNIRL